MSPPQTCPEDRETPADAARELETLETLARRIDGTALHFPRWAVVDGLLISEEKLHSVIEVRGRPSTDAVDTDHDWVDEYKAENLLQAAQALRCRPFFVFSCRCGTLRVLSLPRAIQGLEAQVVGRTDRPGKQVPAFRVPVGRMKEVRP